jgi:hypothetical protein
MPMSTTTEERAVPKAGRQKRHYWLREDFDRLMELLPAADREMLKEMLPESELAADRSSSSSLIYPKTIEGAFRELRLRGLKCDAADLLHLVEQRIVQPAGELSNLQWSKVDIDAAAEWLYENERWDSWTHFCYVCNLRFGQCVQAYRVAAARFSWGFSLSFDPLGRVTVIEPPADPDDYARIRFFPKGTTVEPKEVSR